MKRVYILLLAIALIFPVNIEFKLWILDFKGIELEMNHTLNESNSEYREKIIEMPKINKEFLYDDWFNPIIELIVILPNTDCIIHQCNS